MAYMSQEKKKTLETKIKEILKKYNLKGRVGVRHHSTLVLNITEGQMDFIGNYNETTKPKAEMAGYSFTEAKNNIDVNTHHINTYFSGEVAECLNALKAAMMSGNHDNSDPMTDYFDVGWYIDINIGKWDKPYVFTGKKED